MSKRGLSKFLKSRRFLVLLFFLSCLFAAAGMLNKLGQSQNEGKISEGYVAFKPPFPEEFPVHDGENKLPGVVSTHGSNHVDLGNRVKFQRFFPNIHSQNYIINDNKTRGDNEKNNIGDDSDLRRDNDAIDNKVDNESNNNDDKVNEDLGTEKAKKTTTGRSIEVKGDNEGDENNEIDGRQYKRVGNVDYAVNESDEEVN